MDKRETDTLYSKLGVDPSASAEEIHRAYAALTEKFLATTSNTPSGSTVITEDEKLFRELTQAYRTLVDAESRRVYDRQLSMEQDAALVVHEEQDPQHEMARYQEVILPQHAPTDEWKKEREYFEEHFDEILKPAPKVDLIDSASVPSSAVAADVAAADVATYPSEQPQNGRDDDDDVTVKFGTFPTEREMSSFPAPKSPRRQVSMGLPLDPFDILLYVGLPLFAVILLLEYYFFVM